MLDPAFRRSWNDVGSPLKSRVVVRSNVFQSIFRWACKRSGRGAVRMDNLWTRTDAARYRQRPFGSIRIHCVLCTPPLLLREIHPQSMRTLLVLLTVAMSFVAHSRTIYYGDWIDSAHAATTQGDHAKAQGFYLKAFQRRPPLAKHALECARMSWLLLDTGTTQVYVDHSLDLGITGPEVAADSVLKQFWVSGSAATSKALWSTYRTMEIPELIPIRITDPPDLLALFPHYFSEEVVP